MSETAGPSSGDGAAPRSWIEDIADAGLRERVGKFAGRGVDALAQAYANAEGLLGAPPDSLVRIDDSALNDPSGILLRLGASEKPEGYEIAVDGLPVGTQSADDVKWFQKLAAETRLLPKQAQRLYAAAAELAASKAAEDAKLAEEHVGALQREFGPKFDEEIGFAKTAARELGVAEVLTAAGLGAEPAVVKALARVGRMFGQGSTPGSAAEVRYSPLEAEALAREAKRKELTARLSGNSAEADRFAREARKLYAMAP